jgi:hypothetical protein
MMLRRNISEHRGRQTGQIVAAVIQPSKHSGKD